MTLADDLRQLADLLDANPEYVPGVVTDIRDVIDAITHIQAMNKRAS